MMTLDELFDDPGMLPLEDDGRDFADCACDGCGEESLDLIPHSAHGGFLCTSCRKYGADDVRCNYCNEVENPHDSTERTVRTADTYAGFPVDPFWVHVTCLEKAERPY